MSYLPKCQWVFGQKYPKKFSFFWIFLCRNSSSTKTTVPASFYLKSIELLLISVTLHYLSIIPSCVSAVGTETSEPETSCCVWWRLCCYSSPSHLTPENFVSSSAFCLSFGFFVFVFWPIETTAANLQGLAH